DCSRTALHIPVPLGGAASYRHPCLLCPPGQTLTIQTTAGTHGAGPVTGNPVQFDCAPQAGGGVSATSLHLPPAAAAWQAQTLVRDCAVPPTAWTRTSTSVANGTGRSTSATSSTWGPPKAC